MGDHKVCYNAYFQDNMNPCGGYGDDEGDFAPILYNPEFYFVNSNQITTSQSNSDSYQIYTTDHKIKKAGVISSGDEVFVKGFRVTWQIRENDWGSNSSLENGYRIMCMRPGSGSTTNPMTERQWWDLFSFPAISSYDATNNPSWYQDMHRSVLKYYGHHYKKVMDTGLKPLTVIRTPAQFDAPETATDALTANTNEWTQRVKTKTISQYFKINKTYKMNNPNPGISGSQLDGFPQFNFAFFTSHANIGAWGLDYAAYSPDVSVRMDFYYQEP